MVVLDCLHYRGQDERIEILYLFNQKFYFLYWSQFLSGSGPLHVCVRLVSE